MKRLFTILLGLMLFMPFAAKAEVRAEYFPDPNDPNSPYVKVYWSWGPLTSIIEDFESGDFSAYDWDVTGSYPWEISTEHPQEGAYCMRSTNYNVASSTSSIQVTVDIPRDGYMSFYDYISSESSWDYGYFYIDGVQQFAPTGTAGWTERQYAITEGEHTFKWAYTKDGSVNSGEDRYYVDYINFSFEGDKSGYGLTDSEGRAFSHYRVYRTDCYNMGEYTLENTEVLCCELHDTLFLDVSFADLEPGVYKWGIGCVYAGNRQALDSTLQEPRESPITWSNCLDKNMYIGPTTCDAGAPIRGEYAYDEEDGSFGALISWGGAKSRANLVKYNVYRSADGNDYTQIAQVDAVEGQNYYEYLDASPIGTYYYQVTALYDDDCESDPAPSEENPDVDYVVINITDVAENNLSRLAIYPNPTHGVLVLGSADAAQYSIINLTGKKVKEGNVDASSETAIDVSDLPAGMYFIMVGDETRKFVVK